jgi:tRNA-uridine 2-sulfurtransferase
MKVVVGISGGVDSAVAALLLQQQGHDVTGVYMHNWDEEDDVEAACTALEDHKSAMAVCEHLGIPLQTVNLAAEYRDRVFDYFLAEHRAGRTPNPDVLCNKEIKFKAFLDYAFTAGADRIATGHYARVVERDGPRLLKARDRDKDQTYFLCAVNRAALARTLFPIGELTKPDVRAAARRAGLPNFDRRDSTGICFIGERNYKNFLARYLPPQPGDIRALDGEHKGRHDGLMYYTLGQRQGLGIGGAGGAWYVVGKDMASNVLYIAQGEQHAALYHRALIADAAHWFHEAPVSGTHLAAKTRYRQSDQPCTLELLPEGRLRVSFDTPQRAPTPGQSVVFYDGDECLGGARIIAVESEAATESLRAATC